MKKLFALFCSLVLICTMGTISFAAEETASVLKDNVVLQLDNPSALVNGQKTFIYEPTKLLPVLSNGRTLVPIRFVAESFGAQVEWIGATETVTIDRAGMHLEFAIGSTTFYLNGLPYITDVPAQIINNATMVPMRAVLELLGLFVEYDYATCVILASADYISPEMLADAVALSLPLLTDQPPAPLGSLPFNAIAFNAALVSVYLPGSSPDYFKVYTSRQELQSSSPFILPPYDDAYFQNNILVIFGKEMNMAGAMMDVLDVTGVSAQSIEIQAQIIPSDWGGQVHTFVGARVEISRADWANREITLNYVPYQRP